MVKVSLGNIAKGGAKNSVIGVSMTVAIFTQLISNAAPVFIESLYNDEIVNNLFPMPP